MKKCISLILILALCLCACGKAEKPAAPGGVTPVSESQVPSPVSASLNGSGIQLSPETLPMPEDGVNLADAVQAPGGAFLYGLDSEQHPHFYSLDAQSLEIKALPSLQAEEVSALSASPDGTFWVLAVTEDGLYELRSLAPDGSTDSRPLPAELMGEEPIYNFEAAEGAFFVSTISRAFAFDRQGTLLKDYGEHHDPVSFLKLDSQRTLLIEHGNTGGNRPGAVNSAAIREIGPDLQPGQSYQVETIFTRYLSDGNGGLLGLENRILYRYDYTSGKGEALVNCFISGMTSGTGLLCLEEELYFSIERGQPRVWRPSDGAPAQTLTLATYNMDVALEMAISAFNEKGFGYVIEPIDYAVYDTYDGQDTGLNKLATDLISGNAPDIYDLSRFNANSYAAKGLLEDLKPYFEADEALSYGDLIPNVAKAMEYKGGLYQLVPSFDLVAVAGDRSVIGEDWGVDKFIELTQALPPEEVLGLDLTRENFMGTVLAFMHGQLYSEEELRCDFEAEDFTDMLEFSARLPASFHFDGSQGVDIGRAYAGEQVLLLTSLNTYAVENLSFYDAVFSGETQIVGFPTGRGNGFGFNPRETLAMSSAGEHKAGVWTFFKYLLSEEMHNMGLPLRSSLLENQLDKGIQKAMENPPKLFCASTTGEVQIDGAPVDDSFKDRILELVGKIDCSTVCDQTILQIVMEQAEPFYAGDKTADQVAEAIQSRVKIYLSEQYG